MRGCITKTFGKSSIARHVDDRLGENVPMKDMMEQMISSMSAEEKREMMASMMEAFLGNMAPEERRALISDMMSRMMGSMFSAREGGGSDASPFPEGMADAMRACCAKMGFEARRDEDVERGGPEPEKTEGPSKTRKGGTATTT